MTIHGEVVRLEPALGFGFIRDDHDGDWFFTAADVRVGGLDRLWVGERVGFTHGRSANGPRAIDVHHESVA